MFRQFLVAWVLMISVLLGAVAIGNLFVDPFGIYTGPAWRKLDGFRNLDNRTSKAELIRRSHAHTLIAGSSRALTALDPDDSSLGGVEAINIGLSATNFYEIARAVRYSLEDHPPHRVILGLDFLLFSSARSINQDFLGSRLNPDRPIIEYRLESFLSYRATEASLRSIRNLLANRPQPIDPITGFRHMSLDRLNGSQRNLFKAALRPYLGPSGTYTQFELGDERLRLLAELLGELREKQIETHLLIMPVHAVQLRLIEAIGLWESFENWKRAIAGIAEEQGMRPILDFAMAGPLQTEPIPAADDVTTRMQWFFESSHSQPRFGALCLAQLLGQPRPEHVAQDIWESIRGTLEPSQIDAVLEVQRTLLTAWSADHPKEVEMIAKMIDELGGR